MKHRKGFFTVSIRKRWYVSFLAVLLVPVLAAGMIFFLSDDAITRQTEETNRARLELLVQNMENTIGGVDRITEALFTNPDFALLRYIQSDMAAADRYKLYHYSHSLLRSVAPDPLLLKRAIYLRKSERILDGDAYTTVDRSWVSLFSGISLTLEEYRTLLETPHDRDYLPVTIGPSRAILCLRSMPWTDDRFDATILVAVSVDGILQTLSGTEWSRNGEVLVFDQHENLLLSSGSIESETIRVLADDSIEETAVINGQKYLIISRTNETSGLRYVYVTRYETVYQKAFFLRLMSVLVILFSGICCIMLTVLMVRRNYRPIRNILNRIDEKTEPGGGTYGNEYDYIIRNIEDGKNRQNTLEAELKEKQKILARELLARYLTGRMSWNADTARLFSGTQMAFHCERYRVLYLEAQEFFDEWGGNFAENAANAMISCLEQEGRDLSVWLAFEKSLPILLIGGNAALPEAMILQAMQTLVASYSVRAIAGLSREAGDVQQFPMLFREAATALEHARRRNTKLVCYPEHGTSEPYPVRLEQEMGMIQAVSEGDSGAALQILREMMKSYGDSINTEMEQCLLFDLKALYIRIVACADSRIDRKSWNGIQAPHRMLTASGISEVCGIFREKIPEICRELKKERDQVSGSLSEQVRRYVLEHWNEETLDVNAVSRAFGIHPSYISRMFKEGQGVGLLEFINRCRVEGAARMLTETEDSIVAIAQRCGFSSDAALIRVFKQYRGQTPGYYRKINTVSETEHPGSAEIENRVRFSQ